MDLHRFWGRGDYLQLESDTTTKTMRRRSETARGFSGVSSPNLRNTDFESWAKESFEIATKIAYRNGGHIGSPRAGNKDCLTVTAARSFLRDTF
jgi:hypothetical protein